MEQGDGVFVACDDWRDEHGQPHVEPARRPFDPEMEATVPLGGFDDDDLLPEPGASCTVQMPYAKRGSRLRILRALPFDIEYMPGQSMSMVREAAPVVWSDEHGNCFAVQTFIGTESNGACLDFDRETNQAYAWKLKDTASIHRAAKASQVLRSLGIEAERVTKVVVPRTYLYNGEQIAEPAFKLGLLADYQDRLDYGLARRELSPAEADRRYAAAQDYVARERFVVVARDGLSPIGIKDITLLHGAEFLQYTKELFRILRVLPESRRRHLVGDFVPQDIDPSAGLTEPVRQFLAEVIPRNIGKNLAALHNHQTVAGITGIDEISLLGGFRSCESMRGALIQIDETDRAVTEADKISDVTAILADYRRTETDLHTMFFSLLRRRPRGEVDEICSRFAANFLETYVTDRVDIDATNPRDEKLVSYCAELFPFANRLVSGQVFAPEGMTPHLSQAVKECYRYVSERMQQLWDAGQITAQELIDGTFEARAAERLFAGDAKDDIINASIAELRKTVAESLQSFADHIFPESSDQEALFDAVIANLLTREGLGAGAMLAATVAMKQDRGEFRATQDAFSSRIMPGVAPNVRVIDGEILTEYTGADLLDVLRASSCDKHHGLVLITAPGGARDAEHIEDHLAPWQNVQIVGKDERFVLQYDMIRGEPPLCLGIYLAQDQFPIVEEWLLQEAHAAYDYDTSQAEGAGPDIADQVAALMRKLREDYLVLSLKG